MLFKDRCFMILGTILVVFRVGFVSFGVSPPSAHHTIFSPVKNTKRMLFSFEKIEKGDLDP